MNQTLESELANFIAAPQNGDYLVTLRTPADREAWAIIIETDSQSYGGDFHPRSNTESYARVAYLEGITRSIALAVRCRLHKIEHRLPITPALPLHDAHLMEYREELEIRECIDTGDIYNRYYFRQIRARLEKERLANRITRAQRQVINREKHEAENPARLNALNGRANEIRMDIVRGMSHEQIAKKYDITPAHIRRLTRLKRQLRQAQAAVTIEDAAKGIY